jgi:hypothetical protein
MTQSSSIHRFVAKLGYQLPRGPQDRAVPGHLANQGLRPRPEPLHDPAPNHKTRTRLALVIYYNSEFKRWNSYVVTTITCNLLLPITFNHSRLSSVRMCMLSLLLTVFLVRTAGTLTCENVFAKSHMRS